MPYSLDDFDASLCSEFLPSDNMTRCAYYTEGESELACGFCNRPDKYRCIADTRRPIPLSYSSVSDFLTCHHLYYLKAIRGIQIVPEKTSSAIKRGVLWDRALQNYLGKPQEMKDLIDEYQIPSRDVAAVRGVYRAYKELEIVTEPDGDLQAKIDITIPFDKVWGNRYPVELLVTGFYDRKYPDHFIENKFSGRPENYDDVYFIQSQVGVYFLADPLMEYCIMEIVRSPGLKSVGKFKGENDDEFCERVYQDVLTRPTHYFLGYDNKTHKYGKKFYRTEFNLDELKGRFIHIFREIFDARVCQGWYKDDKACNNVLPGISCDMLPVCRIGSMSEDNYCIRKPKVTW